MLAELVDRAALKREAAAALRSAQVSPRAFVLLFMALTLAMDLVDSFSGEGILGIFVSILVILLTLMLNTGFVLYTMAVRRGERAEFLTLFDAFSFAGKLIALYLLKFLFIFLWSMLFTIPGLVAAYRYRFAVFNLCENPEISPLEAIDMSKRQTWGYKGQLLILDITYLGWMLLASAPYLIYTTGLFFAILQEGGAYYGAGAFPLPDIISLLPVWGWVLVMGLWQLVIAPFYLPNRQYVELGYFETAKRTSGVGLGVTPPPPWNEGRGPDGLGGF